MKGNNNSPLKEVVIIDFINQVSTLNIASN